MALTLPYTIAPDDDIDAEPLSANFQAIADKFSGGIVDADISTLAGISGAKIAANSLPGDRIATGTITKTQMGLLCIDTPQLLALAVTKDKLTTTVGQKITKTQMELYVFEADVSLPPGNGYLGVPRALISAAGVLSTATVGGTSSWIVNVFGVTRDTMQATVLGVSATATPSVAVPSATTTPVGVVLSDMNPVTGAVHVRLYYINNS